MIKTIEDYVYFYNRDLGTQFSKNISSGLGEFSLSAVTKSVEFYKGNVRFFVERLVTFTLGM